MVTNTLVRPLSLAFAGGGTGGHVVPGLHVLSQLRKRRVVLDRVLWFGAGRAIEDRVFDAAGATLKGLVLERVTLALEPPSSGAPSLARVCLRSLPETRRALASLRSHQSQVLVGLGGYTSLPAVLAARRLGVPSVLVEINAVRGKATRWMAPFATRVVHAWPASLPARPSPRHVWFGPPLSSEFSAGPASEEEARAARAALGFAPDRALLLVLGGSQGALALNRFCRTFAPRLAEAGIQVLHQTGPGRRGEGPEERPGISTREYLDDVPRALRAATAVLCRGGASTLAEVAALARPALVVPYPHHRDRHQEKNARSLGDGVQLVPEERLGAAFCEELVCFLGARGEELRSEMSRALARSFPRDGADRLCDQILALARIRAGP